MKLIDLKLKSKKWLNETLFFLKKNKPIFKNKIKKISSAL